MGPTTSSPHVSNGHDAIVEWSGLGGECIKYEWNWHDWNFFAYFIQSLTIVGQ